MQPGDHPTRHHQTKSTAEAVLFQDPTPITVFLEIGALFAGEKPVLFFLFTLYSLY
jgi:hypothetical protein